MIFRTGGVAACAALVLFACKREPEGELVAGVVAALTGANASYGVSMKNGVALAVEEAKKSGRRIRAIEIDDQSSAEEAAAAVQRLVTDDKAQVILGEPSTAPSLAMAPIAQRAEVPMITPSATDPMITEHGEFVFRVCFVDPLQAAVMASFAVEDLKVERVAILRDVDSSYSVALADAFKEKIGARAVRDEAYARTDSDFGAVLAELAKSGAQAVYVPGYATELAKIAPAAAALHLRLLGADGFDAAPLIEEHGRELEGAHFTTHFDALEPRPEVGAFAARYREMFNEAPDAVAALGYDAARVAFTAALAGDGAAFRDAIARTKDFPGVTGVITIDDRRNAVKGVVIVAIENGKRKFIARR